MKHCHDVQKGSNLDLLLRGLIDKQGWLYFLLNAFIGGYNRRTDVMARSLAEQKQVDQLDSDIRAVSDDLKQAVQPQTTKER